MKKQQVPTQLNSEEEFEQDLVARMYIQLAIITEQMSSLMKVLYSNGTIDEEEITAINEDMNGLIKYMSEITNEKQELE